jgi:predicted nucleotidyltransferase/predicted transcriptional regulator
MLLNKQRVLVIGEFLRDYNLKTTGSEIARKKKLNQKSTANVLQELEEEGFLTSEIEGKNKQYFLQKADKETLLHFVLTVEHMRTILFYKKNPLIREIIAKIKLYCKGILIIFGSYAKGRETRDSDLDLFFVGKCNEPEVRKVGEQYSIEINIKEYPHSFLKKAAFKEDYLIKEVIKDHIIVHNAEEFISMLMERCYE